MKYIITVNEDNIEGIYIFPDIVVHQEFYDSILCASKGFEECVSAGFVTISNNMLHCYGLSESLGVESRPQDKNIDFSKLYGVVVKTQWALDLGDDNQYTKLFLSTVADIQQLTKTVTAIKIGGSYNWVRVKGLPHEIITSGEINKINNIVTYDNDELKEKFIML